MKCYFASEALLSIAVFKRELHGHRSSALRFLIAEYLGGCSLLATPMATSKGPKPVLRQDVIATMLGLKQLPGHLCTLACAGRAPILVHFTPASVHRKLSDVLCLAEADSHYMQS